MFPERYQSRFMSIGIGHQISLLRRCIALKPHFSNNFLHFGRNECHLKKEYICLKVIEYFLFGFVYDLFWIFFQIAFGKIYIEKHDLDI